MNNGKKVAVITGITGQDSSYLAEFLIAKGYEVHGLVRPFQPDNSEKALSNILHLHGDPGLHSIMVM